MHSKYTQSLDKTNQIFQSIKKCWTKGSTHYSLLSIIFGAILLFPSFGFKNKNKKALEKDYNNPSLMPIALDMMCTGNATVVSNNGVDNPANAAGVPDGNYAELHQGGDAIILDLGEPLAAITTITVFFRRISNGDPDWTIGSSSTTSGFSGVVESPVNLSFIPSGTASTFTITVHPIQSIRLSR